jgi:acetolactate synthase-1/2/3 large subunit
VRIATSGTPGPVVLVIPEDIQQQVVAQPQWSAHPNPSASAASEVLAQLRGLLTKAERR